MCLFCAQLLGARLTLHAILCLLHDACLVPSKTQAVDAHPV